MRRADSKRRQHKRPGVLVVCDNAGDAHLLARGLNEASFAAATMRYGELELHAANAYAALILVGPEALAACRRARELRVDTRIVVVSAGARFPAGAGTDAGADGVMFNPVLIPDLVAYLRRILTAGPPPSRA